MGVNNQQDDYYESLFRRTTASYRAKIDKENVKRSSAKRRSCDTVPSHNTEPAVAKRKVLTERNNRETPTSPHDLLNRINSTKSPTQKQTANINADSRSLKLLIENILAQVLHQKYSQEFIEKDPSNTSNEKSPIRSIVEKVLKEKRYNLHHSSKEKLNSSEPGSLRSIVENIVTKILDEKFSSLQKEKAKADDSDGMNTINRDIQQKLYISKEQNITLPREPVAHYNSSKSPISQCLVQQLLAPEETAYKNDQNQKSKKSKDDKQLATGCIKRLPRSPRKKSEWHNPNPHDKILDKSVKAVHSQSPVASSSARSGRSKCGSSVLIRRSKSQGRKPNSDPVALYQYYKNEWEHFRNQIPGETPHSRLRWRVRQRLLDAE